MTRCRPRDRRGSWSSPASRRRPPRRHRRAGGDPGGAAASRLAASSCAARYQREPGAPTGGRGAVRRPRGAAIAARIAAFLGRLVAVSRPFAEPGARPAAEASARATLEAQRCSTSRRRWPARHAFRPTCSLATFATCPMGCARPGSSWRRYLWAGRLSRRSDCGRSRRSSRRVRSRSGGQAGGPPKHGRVPGQRLEALGGWDLSDPDLRFSLALATRSCARPPGAELPLLALRPDAVVAAPRAPD